MPPRVVKAKQMLSLPGMEPKGDPARELEDALGPSARVAGLDEAGRGPLAGPVVAAAVVLDRWHGIRGLNDSKVLEPEEREALFPIIMASAAAVGVGVVETPIIDAMNILRASLDAMRIAFEACEAQLGERIRAAVIDGNLKAPLAPRVVQQPVIGGDARSPAIMAASIVAKVTRDRRMCEEALRYPGYGFEQHKGYATPFHRDALMTLGPCPLHRRSFAPVRDAEVLHGITPLDVELVVSGAMAADLDQLELLPAPRAVVVSARHSAVDA